MKRGFAILLGIVTLALIVMGWFESGGAEVPIIEDDVWALA